MLAALTLLFTAIDPLEHVGQDKLLFVDLNSLDCSLAEYCSPNMQSGSHQICCPRLHFKPRALRKTTHREESAGALASSLDEEKEPG